MTSRFRIAVQLAVLLGMGHVGLSACAAPSGPPRLTDSDYPGLIRPPSVLPRDILWQQHVTATWGDRVPRGFDAAVQKQGDTLTVIGMSPVGSTGFVVRLLGGKIEARNDSGEDLPFPPRFILLDVQRVFFRWLSAAGVVPDDGEHDGVVGGEQVVEVMLHGRLAERRFTRVDGKPAGTISVRYQWERDDWEAPSRAVLDNDWFGYRLTIETSQETILPQAPTGAVSSPPLGGR